MISIGVVLELKRHGVFSGVSECSKPSLKLLFAQDGPLGKTII